MQIPNTWDSIEQPSDDQRAGDPWVYDETYREFQEGLKLALEELEHYTELASDLRLKSSPYDSHVERLHRMIEWGEERLSNVSSTGGEIRLSGVSYGSLRY